MKYIYTVAGIILIVLGISGITFLKWHRTAATELARVNGRAITVDEFEKTYGESCSTLPIHQDKKQFLDDLITKEVLIQEAKRLGLDLKEPFRRSIQNYYEQTLLKNLTQEKMAALKISVGEDEIQSYYENMGRVYDLSIITLRNEKEANEAIGRFPSEKADKKSLRMDEIPRELADNVLTLRTGEVYKKPIPCEKGFLVFRLEGYRKEPVLPLAGIREDIRKTLEDKKKGREMEKWLEGLKKKSRIKIYEDLLK